MANNTTANCQRGNVRAYINAVKSVEPPSAPGKKRFGVLVAICSAGKLGASFYFVHPPVASNRRNDTVISLVEGLVRMLGFPLRAQKMRPFSLLSSILRHKPMRPIVRLFTQLHVTAYRLTKGKAQIAKYPTLLLSVKGNKTGKLRTTPLIYITDGERFIIAAAYSGSDHHPAWWVNLRQSQQGVVEVMGRKQRVRPVVVEGQEREDFWTQLVAMYPYFTEYKQRTQREIPIIILEPIKEL